MESDDIKGQDIKPPEIVDLKYVRYGKLPRQLIFNVITDNDDDNKSWDYSGIYGYYQEQNGCIGHIKNRHKKHKHEEPDYYTIKYNANTKKCSLLKESNSLYNAVLLFEAFHEDDPEYPLDEDSNKKISELTLQQKNVMTQYYIDQILNDSNLSDLDKIPNEYVNAIDHYLQQSKIYPQIVCTFDFDKDNLKISNISNKNIEIECYDYKANIKIQSKDEYIKQFIDDMDDRCVPESSKFMNELYEYLSNLNMEYVQLPFTIWKIIIDEYLLCHHLDCDIGTFNNHELRAGGSNSWDFTIFFCYKCHSVWQFPELIGDYSNHKFPLLPVSLINKISIQLPDSNCGWRYYPVGHHFKWKLFDKQKLDKFTYFEYVEKLNERIKNKHTEEKLVELSAKRVCGGWLKMEALLKEIAHILLLFVDCITLNSLLETDICEWDDIFTSKQLLSKYLNTYEMRLRVSEFELNSWRCTISQVVNLNSHYKLNLDIINPSNKTVDVELLLSYYIWRKTYPRTVYYTADSSSEWSDIDYAFNKRYNRDERSTKFKEYMKINLDYAKNWRLQQFDDDIQHKETLINIRKEFSKYSDSCLQCLDPIHHHYFYKYQQNENQEFIPGEWNNYEANYHEVMTLTANNNWNDYKCPSNINVQLLINGYIREFEQEVNHDNNKMDTIIIPIDINDICIKYFYIDNENLFLHNKTIFKWDTFKVAIINPGSYTIKKAKVRQIPMDELLENTLILPNLVNGCIHKWYCIRCLASGVRSCGFVQQLRTLYFGQLRTNHESKLQFIVYCITHHKRFEVSSDEDSSEDDSSDEEGSQGTSHDEESSSD